MSATQATQATQDNNNIENDIENNILNNNINVSNAKVNLEKELDQQIKLKMSTLEDDNKQQRVELMALIDERYNINDSVEEFNTRLRKCFYISHLHENASRIEIFGAASDYELTVYGL